MPKKRLYESVQWPKEANVATYRRFSNPRQPAGTLEKQAMNLREAIARIPGCRHVADYCEPGRSAAKETYDARPQWMRLLDDASKHLFNVVMVEVPDRWSRDEGLFYESMKILRNNNIYFITTDGMTSENMREPGSDIVAAVKISQAASYSRINSKKVTDGKRSRSEHGLYANTCPAFGFTLTDPIIDTASGRYERFLIPDENFPALAIIRDLHLNNSMGAATITTRLTELGYRQTNQRRGKPRGGLVDVSTRSQEGRPITTRLIIGVMHNELYVQYGTTDHGTIMTPDGQRYEGRHPYAWTREEFDRIREMSARLYKAPRAQGIHRSTYPLAGLVVCSGCHLMFMSMTQRSRDRAYRYHICGSRGEQKAERSCSMTRRTTRCDVLEAAFGILLHRTASQHWEEDLAGFLDNLDTEDEEQAREKERQQLQRQLDHLSWQHQHSLIDDAKVLEKSTPIIARLKQLEPVPQKTVGDFHLAMEQLQSVAAYWDAATLEEKRRIAQPIVHPMGLVWDTDNAQIVGLRPFPEFLPGFAVALMPEFAQHEEWLWQVGYPVPSYIPSTESEAVS